MRAIYSVLKSDETIKYISQLDLINIDRMVLNKIFLRSDEIKSKYYTESFFEAILGVDIRGPGDFIDGLEEFIGNIPDQAWFIEMNESLLDGFEFISESMQDFDAVFDALGIEIPDGLDILPGMTEIILGVRLIMDYTDVKKEFSNIPIENQNRLIMAKTLVTLSRFGVTTTLTTLGGISGGTAGVAFGGVGSIIGTPVGAIAGAYTANKLNKKVMPYSREMIFSLLDIDTKDIFYFKNKERIDLIGQNLRNFKLQLQSN
ncbi:hypothetical protein [Exiguobacterium sp. NG55]|uniref:hypothetical protein n=1 Tax=Exiguobacterium sp. NG55 TaxID=375477 RepID=UPI0004DF52EB|nr:hypothetical protein [Exiguobacterium sp. NG55]